MSNRRESLKRIKRLNRATEGHGFKKYYAFGEAEEQAGGLPVFWYIVIAVGAAVLLTTGILLWMHFGHVGDEKVVEEPQVAEDPEPTPAPTVYVADEDPGAEPGEQPEEQEPTEEMAGVATFLQGPKGWKKKIDWAGAWGDRTYDGRRFAGFGCGLCVMANFYCSLTPYQCSPVDMYRYAKEVSSYEGAGAIDWAQIRETLETTGFTVDIGRKPKKYADFKKVIGEAKASMVVVSSVYDNSYWETTYGHYITILGYKPEEDKIFLGDSGNFHHNRQWIPLKTVYKAIKKSNDHHYLRVLGYDESRDQWKHKKIHGKWYRPEYWRD